MRRSFAQCPDRRLPSSACAHLQFPADMEIARSLATTPQSTATSRWSRLPELIRTSETNCPKEAPVYCAFTQVSEPATLTATSEKKSRSGPPSAVPLCSVETRRGPAFL